MRTVALVILALAAPSFAAEVRSGDQVVVREGEVIEDDLYAFGETIRVDGEVRGDVIAFGGEVIVDGDIQGDLISASRGLRLTGMVAGSIRAAGQDLRIDGVIGKDGIFAGANVLLSSGAKVTEDLLAAAGRVKLDAAVGGNAQVRTQSFEVGPQASVLGVLQYSAARAASIPPDAHIGIVEELPGGRKTPGVAWAVLAWLRLVVGLFALGLLLSWLAPKLTLSARGMLRHKPWKSLGAGALAVLVFPLCVALVFAVGALVGGWWLGFIALAAMAVAAALAFPVVGLLVGDWLLRHPGHERAQVLLALAVGVPLLALLVRLPILGGLAALATVLFGLGALLLAAWRLRSVPVMP